MLKKLPPVVWIPLKILASAGFATVTIVLCMLILIWSTFWGVKVYGLAATEFGVYQSWWFALLMLLLGINVLAATIVKLPWRRSQTGFLVVHAGIIILLIGCWLTREYGMNGRLRVAEGETASLVTENSQHFQLQITDLLNQEEPKTITIPFNPGPFNWCDYDRLPWFPWHWAHRDRGTIYDNAEEGIKLEVLDYWSDSEMLSAPRLVLDVQPVHSGFHGMMNEKSSDVTLFVDPRSREHQKGSMARLPAGGLVSFSLVDSKAAVRAFLDASPKTPLGPLGQVVLHVIKGPGASPKAYRFSVAKLIEDGGAMIGDTSLHVEVKQFWPELMRVKLSVFDIKKHGVKPRTILLNAFQPIANRQDPDGQIWAGYWFSPYLEDMKEDMKPGGKNPQKPEKLEKPEGAEKSKADLEDRDLAETAFVDAIFKVMKIRGKVIKGKHDLEKRIEKNDPDLKSDFADWFVSNKIPRIDLIQGPAGVLPEKENKEKAAATKVPLQLYQREWNGRRITSAGLFDPDAKQTEWLAQNGYSLQVKVVEYLPAEFPCILIRPLPFQKNVPDKNKTSTTQRVQIRLTAGGMSETFWLVEPNSAMPPSDWRKAVIDKNRQVSVMLGCNRVKLGFGVHLDDFTIDRGPDMQPTRYVSQVDFVQLPDPKRDEKSDTVYEKDVTIEGNRPATFKDPSTGRVYRFFQTGFEGPYHADNPEFQEKFQELTGENRKRKSFYCSIYSVAYDPGRFWKYAGCFMIIFGIAIMYYMKAYFFRRFSGKMEQDQKQEH